MIKFISNYTCKLAIALLCLAGTNCAFSQISTRSEFESPLHIPLLLSGNYGELRSTHFHAGIDLKTLGETGQPVHASKEGYISRIKIQSGGYGRSIYITHPNGLKTVYGHLQSFHPEIEAYVKQNQYKLQRFEVNLYPPKEKFILNQGQQFALSGNTGRSGGPHLHFEIRKSNNDVPLNVLKFDLPVKDNISPEFRNLYVYSFQENSVTGSNGEKRKGYSVSKRNDTSYYISNTVIVENEFCGFGTEVYDFLNGSNNRCGVYTLDLLINDVQEFSFVINAISFQKTRYINAHMDYDLKISEKKSVHRLFKLPNNELPIYSVNHSGDLMKIKKDSLYFGKIVACDAYGNRSVLEFKFKSTIDSVAPLNSDKTTLVRWNEGYDFSNNTTRIKIPPGALYRDIYFKYSELASPSMYGDTLCIHYDTEPLHRKITIKIVPDTIPAQFVSKLVIARIEDGELSYEGSEWQNNYITAQTRDFGKFIVTIDTVSPEIVPINFIEEGEYQAGDRLRFRVTDDLSGLKSYNAFIDNQWVLLEYDAKNDLMYYTIDKDRMSVGKNHTMKLHVVDNMKNVAIFENQFTY